jgi:hypothetical protein
VCAIETDMGVHTAIGFSYAGTSEGEEIVQNLMNTFLKVF